MYRKNVSVEMGAIRCFRRPLECIPKAKQGLLDSFLPCFSCKMVVIGIEVYLGGEGIGCEGGKTILWMMFCR